MGMEMKIMVKKKAVMEREFPLISKSYRKREASFTANSEVYGFVTPNYVWENLRHKLRNYQNEALFNLNWTQIDNEADAKYNHLLFNMATGSGKTDLMGAVMLYMYGRFGYQNFLFVANSNVVVSKTKENFLNDGSTKYLFNKPLVINGEHLKIRNVEQFPLHPNKSTIYLRLTTIQTLANELSKYRENGLTYEDLARQKLVILADEAHHFNASTKKEKENEHSWEKVLDKVRKGNPSNRQFEFTATIDVDKDSVYNKYKNKIVYKYELNRFMEDGYSKNVKRLESNQNDQDKMMNAVLLSQFRKRIAKDHGIENFKPVILFKSNRIKDSKIAQKNFINMMESLTTSELHKFIVDRLNTTKSQTLSKTYHYWLTQDFSTTVAELKRDFQKFTTINVNDGNKGLLEDKGNFNNLNTLEEPNNPLRTVFAVAKLTEGWDVLNLYDIVKLGEKISSIKETNQEAQLVGRGARYYPFIYKGKSSFTRRFDSDDDLSLIETMFYHTINDPIYIKRLHMAFNKMNLLSESDSGDDYEIYTAKVKPSFMQTNFYKQGYLYCNRLEVVSDDEYDSLQRYGINNREIIINMNISTTENDLNFNSRELTNTEDRIVARFNSSRDRLLINKAISRDSFFRFAKLKQYIPTLRSVNEFLHGQKWLGPLRIKATVAYGYRSLSNEERCEAVQRALGRIKKQIIMNYHKKRGTNIFEPVSVNKVIVDYQKRVSTHTTGTTNLIGPEDMSKDKWFVYDNAIVDRLENNLIKMIRSFIKDTNLGDKYHNIYLLRIEERLQRFKLYEYQPMAESHYQSYMPDFILCMNDAEFNYQIFVESKGTEFLIQDQWKQDFLENLDPEKITIIGENDKVRLLGVKFYVNDNGKHDVRGTEDELKGKLNVQNRSLLN